MGQHALIDLLNERGADIAGQHMDCGIEVFDAASQDTHAGGSGCGCSASVFSGNILRRMRCGELSRVLLISTGAMLSTISPFQGESIPGIAHAVSLATC